MVKVKMRSGNKPFDFYIQGSMIKVQSGFQTQP
jgi:hypothetical protein